MFSLVTAYVFVEIKWNRSNRFNIRSVYNPETSGILPKVRSSLKFYINTQSIYLSICVLLTLYTFV